MRIRQRSIFTVFFFFFFLTRTIFPLVFLDLNEAKRRKRERERAQQKIIDLSKWEKKITREKKNEISNITEASKASTIVYFASKRTLRSNCISKALFLLTQETKLERILSYFKHWRCCIAASVRSSWETLTHLRLLCELPSPKCPQLCYQQSRKVHYM